MPHRRGNDAVREASALTTGPMPICYGPQADVFPHRRPMPATPSVVAPGGAADEVAAGREPLEEPVEVALGEAGSGGIGIDIVPQLAGVSRARPAPAPPGAARRPPRRRRPGRGGRGSTTWRGGRGRRSARRAARGRRRPRGGSRCASPAIASTSTASDGAARNDRRSSDTRPMGPATATDGSPSAATIAGRSSPGATIPGPSSTTTGEAARRRPAFHAAAAPTRVAVRTTSVATPGAPGPAASTRSNAASASPSSSDGALATITTCVPSGEPSAIASAWRIAPATSSVATMTTVATPAGASSSRDGTEAVEP